MKRNIIIALILFAIVAVPAAAHASGILNITITGIFGCVGGGLFVSGCVTDSKMLFTTIACKVMQTIDAAIIPIYCNITQNPVYINALNSLLILYVVIFGLSYLIGLNQKKLGVVLLGMLKVAFIYTILTNAGLFFNLIYRMAVQTPKDFVDIILAAHGSTAGSIFEYVDQGMYKVFEELSQPNLDPDDRQTFVAKEMSILAIALGVKTLIPGGNFIYGLFIFVVMGWLFSYLMVVVRYLLSYLALTFMLMLAPIFIPSLLFKKTAFLFDEWLRMLLSFVIEIILVVAYVLMIEPFYREFYDMLQRAMRPGSAGGLGGLLPNGINFDKKDTNYLKAYNTGSNTEYYKEESVQGIENPVPKMNQAGFSGDATDISAEVIGELITMAAVVFLSSVFLRYIPTLASMLAGKYNFSKLFGGEQFAQKASSAGRANLFGQDGYKGKQDSTTPDADKEGGIWSDFSQNFRL